MDEQQLQEKIVLLVQAAMQGDQLATLQIQQIMQAAQQGDQQATQLALMIQTVAQQIQLQQVQAAKFGAKLNYIKRLRGQCPEGFEMQYFKQGGPMGNQICKRCVLKQKKMEEGGEVSSNPIDAFKCGRKMKKKKENGGNIEMDKCGSKMKKKACGGSVKKISKKLIGGVLEAPIGFAGSTLGAAAIRGIPKRKIVWSAEDPTTGIDPSGVVVHRSLEAVEASRRKLAILQFANDIYALDKNLYNQQRLTVQAAQQRDDNFRNRVFNFIKF